MVRNLKRVGFTLCFIVIAAAFGGIVGAVTASYNSTIRIVDSSGNVLGGTASATTGVYNQTVRVVDSTGHVLDTLGSSGITSGTTTITSGTSTYICFDASGVINCSSTSSAGRINNLGVNVAPDGTPGDLGVAQSAGIGHAPSGTLSQLDIGSGGTDSPIVTLHEDSNATISTIQASLGNQIQFQGAHNVYIGDSNSGNKVVFNEGTEALTSDNAVGSMARMPLAFSLNQQTALVATEHMGTHLTTKAITIENVTFDELNVTCASAARLVCYDCGTAVGACTSSQTSTIWDSGAGAVTTALTGTSVAGGSITTANVAAAHYITCEVTAGTCAVFAVNVSLMARPQ